MTCLVMKYATFSGRASRSEYWFWTLGVLIASFVAGLLDAVLGLVSDGGVGLLGAVLSLVVVLPGLAVAVRRLHDTGRTGWWMLVVLVPLLGSLVMIVFLCLPPQRVVNRYG